MNAKELDVVDFQKAVEIAYGERLAFLQENLFRVRTISDHCKDWFDRYYSWQPPTNSSTIDASGKGFVSIREDRRERELYAFGKRVPAIRVASSAREVNTKELFPKRVKILDRFITKAEKYLSGASSFLLPHAVVQYAVDKFEIREWSGPESLASAYCARLLSPKDQATFLLDLKSTDKELSSRLLSILSRISGTTSVYQAVCDGNFDGLMKLLSSIEQASLLCAQEVSSWRNALSVSDIRDLDALIEALQSIQETFFLQPVIPVLDNLDGEIWTTLNYTDWPENTWGDKEQVEEIVKSIATRQGESGTAGVPNTTLLKGKGGRKLGCWLASEKREEEAIWREVIRKSVWNDVMGELAVFDFPDFTPLKIKKVQIQLAAALIYRGAENRGIAKKFGKGLGRPYKRTLDYIDGFDEELMPKYMLLLDTWQRIKENRRELSKLTNDRLVYNNQTRRTTLYIKESVEKSIYETYSHTDRELGRVLEANITRIQPVLTMIEKKLERKYLEKGRQP